MVTVSEMSTDARVCREAETLASEGYTVKILCLKSPVVPIVHDVELIELDFSKMSRGVSLAAKSLSFFLHTMVRNADIYHAHNVPALPGCWLASRIRRSRLVYDAHELHSLEGRIPMGKHGTHTVRERVEAAIEKILARRADLFLTAGESYGHVIARSLKIEVPLVVPNYPPLPKPNDGSPLRALIGASLDEIIVLYQGGFYLETRSLETLILGMSFLPENYRLVLLGFGNEGDIAKLADLAISIGVQDRVIILPPVRHQELAQYTNGANVGVIPLRLDDPAAQYCAPNKLYEYFQSSVAVLSTDVKELVDILERTGAGRSYIFDSRRDFAIQVMALGSTVEELNIVGKRGRVAAEERYSWEAVKHLLIEAYLSLEQFTKS